MKHNKLRLSIFFFSNERKKASNEKGKRDDDNLPKT